MHARGGWSHPPAAPASAPPPVQATSLQVLGPLPPLLRSLGLLALAPPPPPCLALALQLAALLSAGATARMHRQARVGSFPIFILPLITF
jgi:hypothetical protein